MAHPISLPLFIICYLLFDFINLCSISCHCLLWTFIIIDSQLFNPSFRTYAFVYSYTDCCRSQLFFLKEFFFRQQLPLFCYLPLSSIVFPFLLFLMFLYYSCISLFNIFFDSHFRMFRFDPSWLYCSMLLSEHSRLAAGVTIFCIWIFLNKCIMSSAMGRRYSFITYLFFADVYLTCLPISCFRYQAFLYKTSHLRQQALLFYDFHTILVSYGFVLI